MGNPELLISLLQVFLGKGLMSSKIPRMTESNSFWMECLKSKLDLIPLAKRRCDGFGQHNANFVVLKYR